MAPRLAVLVAVGGLVLGSVRADAAFFRGDVNLDSSMDVSDAVAVLGHLFVADLTAPCEKAADVNDDGAVNIADAIYALQYLFSAGPPPPPPFGRCGEDPTPDGLSCLESPCQVTAPCAFISEIMASNADSLDDEDGDSSDWIEIAVTCEEPLDLDGWFLTDDASFLTKWRFPAVTVVPAEYLIVFASDKDRRDAGSELHTNFKLDGDGDYLALVAPDGVTVVDEYAPAYPEQLTDVSYGPVRPAEILVGEGSSVRYHVPMSADDALEDTWADPGFSPAGLLVSGRLSGRCPRRPRAHLLGWVCGALAARRLSYLRRPSAEVVFPPPSAPLFSARQVPKGAAER